jgi:hypothetical protein
MREHHVGSLVVVKEDAVPRVPVGMITDRDLAVGSWRSAWTRKRRWSKQCLDQHQTRA